MDRTILDKLSVPTPPYRAWHPESARFAMADEPIPPHRADQMSEEAIRKTFEGMGTEEPKKESESVVAHVEEAKKEVLSAPPIPEATPEIAAKDQENKVTVVRKLDSFLEELESVERAREAAQKRGDTKEAQRLSKLEEAYNVPVLKEQERGLRRDFVKVHEAGDKKEAFRLGADLKDIQTEIKRAEGTVPKPTNPPAVEQPTESPGAAKVGDIITEGKTQARVLEVDKTGRPTRLDTINLRSIPLKDLTGQERARLGVPAEVPPPTVEKPSEPSEKEIEFKQAPEQEKSVGQRAQEALNAYRSAVETKNIRPEELAWAKGRYLQAQAEYEVWKKSNRPAKPVEQIGSETVRYQLTPELKKQLDEANEQRIAREARERQERETPPRVLTEQEKIIAQQGKVIAELQERLARLEARPSAPRQVENERPLPRPERQERQEEGPGEAEQDLKNIPGIEEMGDDHEPSWWGSVGMRTERVMHDVAAWWSGVLAKRAKDSLSTREGKVKELEKAAQALAEKNWLGALASPFRYGARINYHRWREGLVRASFERHDDNRALHENARNEVLNIMANRLDLALKTREERARKYAEESEQIDRELDGVDADLDVISQAYAGERDSGMKRELLNDHTKFTKKYEERRARRGLADRKWQSENERAILLQRIKNQILKKATPGDRPNTEFGERKRLKTRVKRMPSRLGASNFPEYQKKPGATVVVPRTEAEAV